MHSFEPVPATFALLSYSARRLRLRNASSTTRGLSRRRHRGHDVPRYPAGGENYHQENLVVGGAGQSDRLPQFSVELRKGGLGADEAGAVDHVHQVRRPEARGESPGRAASIIERHRPALCVEVTSDPDTGGSSTHQIVSRLGRCGYEPFWLGAGSSFAEPAISR